MTYPFRALDELEAQLTRVVTDSRTGRHSATRAGVGRLAPLAAAGALVLATATITLAATGVILNGTPVAPPPSVSPDAGIGLPIPGQSKLLSLRVSDPNGGLPWGMRIVPTTRGLLCVQIGRVQNGQLGEIGIDGAFNNDGRFHPVGPAVLPTYAGGAPQGGVVAERGTCVLDAASGDAWGSAVTAEYGDVSENAAFAPQQQPGQPGQQRDISYGVLGPHAVSVSYREGGTTHIQQVVPGLGAYLIVQPAGGGTLQKGQGEAPGTATPGEGPGATGALNLITYEYNGKICENGADARTGGGVTVEHPCPPPSPYTTSAHITPPGAFVRQLQTTLRVSHGDVVAADVSFAAPFPVASAQEGYSLRAKPCGPHEEGPGIAVLDHNVGQDAAVHLILPYPFQALCANGSVTVEALYESSGREAKTSPGMTPGQLLIGTTTIRLPDGDRAATPPHATGP